MKKSKIIVLILVFSLLVCTVFAVAASAFAKNDTKSGDSLAADSWVSAPGKTLVKCPGGSCDHQSCDYVYSFAVVGDTQNLNHIDAKNYTAAKKQNAALTYETYTSAYMRTLYNWILNNKESKNIQYVMGLGDITQSFNTSQTYYDEEWALAKEALSLLDGKIGYSLVRGNHDISSGFNGAFGSGTAYYNAIADLAATTDSEGRPMAGFRDASKIEDSYRKIVTSNGDKYIIFTLEYYPTEQTVAWLNETLAANLDYDAIITLHSFLNKDSTFVNDFETTTPAEDATNSKWDQTATGGNVDPVTLWETSLSKHANVKLILSGHVAVEDVVVNQLKGENGNTVTCMLIDGQTIDDVIEPVGLVAMFYVSADGSIMNVEYISTVRDAKNDSTNTPAYLKAKNQFEITVDYGDAWTTTAYGDVPTSEYESNTFNVFLDDDAIADNTNFYFGGYDTWEETLNAIHAWNGLGGVDARAKKTYNIVMRKDYTFSKGIAPKNSGSNPGKFNLDLGDNVLTLGGNGVLVPFYNNRTDGASAFTVQNGSVIMSGTANLAVLQTSIKENGSKITLNLEGLEISYNNSVSPIVGMYGGFAGYKASVDLNVTDCTIDTTGASGTVTLFALEDTHNNNDVSLKIEGGSIIGTNSANTVIYSLNSGSDKAWFAEDENGNYTTVVLNENAAPAGIFRNEEGKLLSFVTESAEAPYVFTTEIAPVEETPYGYIPIDVYPAASYPFVLFQNGEIVAAYSTWYDFCQNIYSVSTVDDKNTVLYLRKNITVDKTSNQLRNVKNLTIDLGENTITTSVTIFNLMAEGNYSFTTNISVKNGTVTAAKAWAPIVAYNSANTSDVECCFNMVFDGVTMNATSDFEGRLLVEAWKDGTYGTKNSLVFNSCTFDATVGAVSKLFQLDESAKKDETEKQNKVDVSLTFNGGKLIANKYFTLGTFSEEREAGKGSPDTLTFGRDSNGAAFCLQMPNTQAQPTTGIATTNGMYYPIETLDDGTNSIYYFKSNVTNYGSIGTSYLSEVDYPFVLFQNGEFKAAYKKWNSGGFIADIENLDTSPATNSTLLLRRDYNTTSYSGTSYGLNKLDTLKLDLDGHTLTRGDYHLFQLYAQNANVNMNMTVENGTICVTKNYSTPINLNGACTTSGLKIEFNMTFNNVTFTSSSAFKGRLVVEPNTGGTYGSTTNLTFNGCNFIEGGTNVDDIFRLRSSSSPEGGKFDVNVVVNGGSFTLLEDIKIISDYKDGEDSVIFGAYNGSYPKFIKIKGAVAPTDAFVAANGASISFANVSTSANAIYQLGEDIETEYGTIAFAYADTENYPFALFKNGEMIYAFSNWMLFIEKDAVLNEEYRTGCTIVLRRDFTTDQGNSQNMCYITDMVIDLQGHRLIRGASHLFQAYGKLTSTTSQTTDITVKNGAVLVGASNAPIAFNNTTNGARHKFNFTFDNVIFGRVSGGSGKLVAESFTGGTYGSDNTITLNNCIISLVNDEKYGTVAPSGAAAWFDLDDKKTGYENGFNSISVVINGGEVRLADAAHLSLGTMDKEGDSITFAKSGGNYTAFTLPSGAVAPTVSINGGDLKFVKISDDGLTVTYRLRPAEVANIDFVPKMSLTLDRDLVLNVYVPAKDFLAGFTLDGVEYTNLDKLEKVTVDGKDYYLVSISLDAKNAARDVVLRASVSLGDKTATATFTFGIIKYAEKILADGSAVEKTLVKDVLSYVRAAYTYFGTNDAQTVSRINTILGDNYDANNAPTVEGSATAETEGLKSATFVLDGTPSMRFYLADGADASKYAFFIDGIRVKTETSADGKYIDIDVYAYALCEIVTYTIDGVESGSFHIRAYYEWSKSQNNENLVNLTARFWKYLQSARDYRDSVVEG